MGQIIEIEEPTYEQDDGALSLDQLSDIRELSTATKIPDESFTEKLF